jgi:hypothetical protein
VRAPLSSTIRCVLKLSTISQLLAGEIDPKRFLAECDSDLKERREIVGGDGQVLKRGSVVPVRVSDDCSVLVSRQGVATLCHHFVQGDLGPIELAYIADALQLAEDVSWEDDDVAEWVAEFTDPEINGPLTSKRAHEIAKAIA